MQSELESVKNQSSTNKEMIETNQDMIQEDRIMIQEDRIKINGLDEMSRVGTSCSSIASLGNLESGTFFLDTDGLKNGEAPYEVSYS